MSLRFLLAAALVLLPSIASAEIVRPTRYGEWDVRCFSGRTGSGQPSCHIDRIVRRADAHGRETLLYLNISSGFDERLTVQTTGPNRATCETLYLREQVRRGYNPYNDEPTDVLIAALHGRLITTLESHIPVFAICTAMQRHVSDFSTEVLADRAELRRAIEHVEQHWTWLRNQTNPVFRARRGRN